MERPERIVLFMIGAFTNRMAGVLWVILVLSILAVANRIYYTYLALNGLPMPSQRGPAGMFNRAFFWTDERATLPYDLWVIAILAFVWLTPPDWLGDPTATGLGLARLSGGPARSADDRRSAIRLPIALAYQARLPLGLAPSPTRASCRLGSPSRSSSCRAD